MKKCHKIALLVGLIASVAAIVATITTVCLLHQKRKEKMKSSSIIWTALFNEDSRAAAVRKSKINSGLFSPLQAESGPFFAACPSVLSVFRNGAAG